jgi:hypothetical protein
MQSLLYWEPRRVRVVVAKILGLLVVAATDSQIVYDFTV